MRVGESYKERQGQNEGGIRQTRFDETRHAKRKKGKDEQGYTAAKRCNKGHADIQCDPQEKE